ncbi:MAG: hypothetical protein M3M96_02225 [Candidatus Eremiobacteraeota bacterium]|nr:hypothetical protein [Candidatus Eremiobacteraeota bacterium]
MRIALAFLMTLALAAPAAAQTAGSLSFHRTLSAGPRDVVAVEADHGNFSASVHVAAWQKNSVQVDVSGTGSDAGQVEVTAVRTGNRIQITARRDSQGGFWSHVFGNFGHSPNLAIEVRVPATVVLEVATTNGHVGVEALSGSVTATTVNGSVEIRDGGSVLHLESVNGGITASIARMSGAPDISIKTVNGGVHLSVPSNFGARITTSTVNGGVRNPFANARRSGSASVETVNGGITITTR